jgi:hypothetical protein
MTPLCPVYEEPVKNQGRTFEYETCRQIIIFFTIADASPYIALPAMTEQPNKQFIGDKGPHVRDPRPNHPPLDSQRRTVFQLDANVLTADASGLTKVEDKAPAGQVEAGRKVFVVMQNDGSDAAAVVIGAEDVKPP